MGYMNAFCALGLCLASLGPALLSLAEQTSSTLQFTGYCFMVRSVGYAAGSFAGPLYDRMPGHAIMGGSLLAAALGTALIPAARSVYALGAIVSLQGISMGTLDTGGNVMLIYIFGAEVGPWMQGLHAAFAVGAWLAPLFLRAVEGDRAAQADGLVAQHSYDAAFYLIAAYCAAVGLAILSMRSPRSRAAAHGEAAGSAVATAAVAAAASASADAPATTSGGVQFAGALGAPDGGASASLTGEGRGGDGEMRVELAMLDGSVASPSPASTGAASSSSSGSGGGSGGSGGSGAAATAGAPAAGEGAAAADDDVSTLGALDLSRETWKVVALVAGFLGLYVGAETGYGGFVTSYAVLQLGMSEADGQLVASAYWAAIMAGRFAAIYVSTLIKPGRYLVVSVAGSLLSAVLLLLGAPWSELALWLGTLAFGVCMACIFPTAIAFAESAFPVVGAHATAFVVGSATGEVVLPFFIATLFGAEPGEGDGGGSAPAPKPGTVGPVVMLWIVLVGCIGMAGMLWWLMRAADRLSRAIAVHKARKAAAGAGAGV
jgi:FHS family Na+ dependent glucose MFS transporter 1